MTENPEPSVLNTVISFIRARQLDDARDLLIPYLKENPKSDAGWFLLSYALEDFQQKEHCLERAIHINPDNARARERLHKLRALPPAPPEKASATQVAEQTQKSKRNWRWVLYPAVVLVLVILILGAYFGVRIFLPGLLAPGAQESAQVPAVESPPTATHTPTPLPTQTSTPLPTQSPTPSLSPTDSVPTATEIPPTPTREFPEPQGDLAQQMDDIQNQVSTLRGLNILAFGPRYLIPENKVRKTLTDLFLERYSRDDVRDQAKILEALGLVKPNYDLYSKVINDIGEGLGGFYIPWTDETFVIGEEFGAVEKLIYAHEYEHALADQHYRLETIGVYPECLRETDRCNAITALIEGDATYLMYQWQQAYASPEEIAAVEQAGFVPTDKVISSHSFPPPYVIRDTYFKYFDGQNFVAALLEGVGEEAVEEGEEGSDEGAEEGEAVEDAPVNWQPLDAAYENLPLSSEQILHPEKYLAGEKPVEVDLRSIEGLLGEGWRLLTTDTLGELSTQMILGYNENYLVQLDPITAAEAAAGWGGDRYQVFYRSKSNHIVLVALWAWDTPEDAGQFWDAMLDYLNRRYAGRAAADMENCWTKINDHFSCVYRAREKTLWIMAPTLEMVEDILDRYPGF